MTPRTFTALALVAAGSLAAAALVHANANSWVDRLPGGAKLFPDLPRNAAAVATLAIKRGEDTLTLARAGDAWTLKDKGGYPAQADKVRQLMVRMANAELIETKTRNPDRFDLLDVGDPAKKDGNATLLTLADDKGGKLAEVIVGKRSAEQLGTGKSGTYVRRPGQNQAWLTDTDLSAAIGLSSWIDTIVLEMDTAKVTKLVVDVPGEPQLTVEKPAGGEAKLQAVPDGQKLKSDGTPGYMVDALSRLDLEDVRKAAATLPAAPLKAVATTASGLAVTLSARGEGDNRWVTVSAAGEGDAKDEAAKINARAGGWEYKLASWKLDQVFKKRDELLEPNQPAEGQPPR